MGLLAAIATVVAGTLGAGLFVTIGTASSTTGPSVILGVLITGVVAMSIGTYYCWMATIFPAAGGSYTYLSRTFQSRPIGFLVTWTKWLGYIAADAVLAIGFGSYLNVFLPDVPPAVSGFVLLTVLFVINLLGTKAYSASQNIMFALLLAAILVLVLPGLFSIDLANYQPFFTGGFNGFTAATVPLFYAYIGIEVAAQMGAEVKNPARNLPLAMVGGIGILIALFMLTALVIYGVVGDYTLLADSDRPLVTAADTFLGEAAVILVGVGGLLATATSVHAVMIAAVKLPYSWSWDEVFPSWFSDVNKRFQTPHWSLLTLYVGASLLMFWSGGLDRAIAIATFAYLVAYITVAVAALYIYMRKPKLAARAAFHPGPWFYIPLFIGGVGSVAIISQAAEWGALFTGQFGELTTFAIYLPWLAFGVVVYGFFHQLGKKRGTDVDAILDTVPGDSAARMSSVTQESSSGETGPKS
ncbi:MAG TPA: APC family permease [Ornithinimicrobium sp.]|uniref:APC family permease n=1 Tax=Ornithinimicrobium sp. TaxID=1977084 RepID=UPI002B48431A|nr:APC family permease [Ornithinimicrobium sp.]HKJ10871.1 APC family permease [Ornithinimicrobium sp.]